jgi:hypothetical protein
MITSYTSKRWIISGTALVSCVAGLTIGRLMHANQTRTNSNRVFELRIYHALPGKGPALESVFRDAAKVMDKHGINVVG